MTYRTGVALVLVAGLLWSFMGLAIRQIDVAGTWAIVLWRSVGMVPVLFVWIAWTSGGHPFRQVRQVGMAGVIGGLGLVLAFAGSIFAFQTTTIANAVFLFAAAPFFAAVLGWLVLREPVRPRDMDRDSHRLPRHSRHGARGTGWGCHSWQPLGPRLGAWVCGLHHHAPLGEAG